MNSHEADDVVYSNKIKTEGESLKCEDAMSLTEPVLKSPRRAKRKYRHAVKEGGGHEYAPIGHTAASSVLHRGGAPSWGSIVCVCVVIGLVVAFITVGALFSNTRLESPVPGRICQLQHQSNSAGEAFLNDWQSFSCQRVYKCNTQTGYLIDRTCTVEDITSPVGAPIPRGVDVLVAKDFKIVYVRNPSAVDAIVRYIMINLFSAYEINSHVLTTSEVKEYFFFTFVGRTLDRFSLGFTEKGLSIHALNSTSNCENVSALFPLAFSENWVPSQSFFLSGDAGSMNHMIRFDWIGDASDVSNVLYVFEHIQASMPAGICLPEINFQQLNYEFIRGRQQTRELSKRVEGCIDSVTSAHIISYYRQDEMCWFT